MPLRQLRWFGFAPRASRKRWRVRKLQFLGTTRNHKKSENNLTKLISLHELLPTSLAAWILRFQRSASSCFGQILDLPYWNPPNTRHWRYSLTSRSGGQPTSKRDQSAMRGMFAMFQWRKSCESSNHQVFLHLHPARTQFSNQDWLQKPQAAPNAWLGDWETGLNVDRVKNITTWASSPCIKTISRQYTISIVCLCGWQNHEHQHFTGN